MLQLAAHRGGEILWIGCGTGHWPVELDEMVGSDGKVLGIDVSEEMVALAKDRIREEGVGNRVEHACGDGRAVEAVEFEVGAAEIAHISVLVECVLAVRPGGKN